MRAELKNTFYQELHLAHTSVNTEEKWNHLARAHIIGQFDSYAHLLVHWKMFKLGIKTSNWQEIFGQIPRMILSIPGSLTKKAPLGNTGLSNVGIFTPMEIPEDLKKLF